MPVKIKVNRKDKEQKPTADVAEEVIEEASVAEGTAENETEEADENTEAEAPEPAAPAPKAPEVAVINQTPKDRVRITMIQDMTPPTVGNFDFERELKVKRLVQRESYVVPRHVAEVLIDSRSAIVAQ